VTFKTGNWTVSGPILDGSGMDVSDNYIRHLIPADICLIDP